MEQKAVCGGFLVGDGLEMNGKVLSATGGGAKFYTDIGDEDGYRIENAGADIDSIMSNGGFTIYYPEDQSYNHFIFGYTTLNGIYGVQYVFFESSYDIFDGVTLDYTPFVIVGNDLIQFIDEP